MSDLCVVTGAFGFTGSHIARRLLASGKPVKTLTGHPDRGGPFEGRIDVAALSFDDAAALASSLRGARVLYNTYWIRFERGTATFDKAVENTKKLIRAAEDARVEKIVHVSITGASPGSPVPYFRGKGLAEEAVRGSKLSHAIVKPTVVFGPDDVLINNIAWLLRRFPVFAIAGTGKHRVQPVFVEDVARIAVEAAEQPGGVEIDAVGPDTFTFEEMVRLIAQRVGSRARLVHASPRLVVLLASALGLAVRDVVLTRDEIAGLSADLLVSAGPPTGATRLRDWLDQHHDAVGRSYASELSRHYQ